MNNAVGHHGGVNRVSVSLVVPFGRLPAPAPVVVTAPVAPVAAPPARRRVSFSAESRFTFDKSDLRPEGKAAPMPSRPPCGLRAVDAARVSAVGKSKSAPVTNPKDCKGGKPSAELIACLQPDRRVEIEGVGSR